MADFATEEEIRKTFPTLDTQTKREILENSRMEYKRQLNGIDALQIMSSDVNNMSDDDMLNQMIRLSNFMSPQATGPKISDMRGKLLGKKDPSPMPTTVSYEENQKNLKDFSNAAKDLLGKKDN